MLNLRSVSGLRGTANAGMQMAEWIGGSGESIIEGASGNTDEEGVPQITAGGDNHCTTMVMAARAVIHA